MTLRTATVAFSVGVAVICMPWSNAQAAPGPAPSPAPAVLTVPALNLPLLTLSPLAVPLPLPSLDPILKTLPLPVPLPAVDPLLKELLDLDPILTPILLPPPPGGGTIVPPVVVPPVVIQPPVVVPPPGAGVPGGQPPVAGRPGQAVPAAPGGAKPASTPQLAAKSAIGSSGGVQKVSASADIKQGLRPTWRDVFTSGSGATRGLIIPLFLVVVLAGFLGVQRVIDRRDPKLAQSPAWPEPDLRFG